MFSKLLGGWQKSPILGLAYLDVSAWFNSVVTDFRKRCYLIVQPCKSMSPIIAGALGNAYRIEIVYGYFVDLFYLFSLGWLCNLLYHSILNLFVVSSSSTLFKGLFIDGSVVMKFFLSEKKSGRNRYESLMKIELYYYVAHECIVCYKSGVPIFVRNNLVS